MAQTKESIQAELEEDVKSLIPLQAEVLQLEQIPEVAKYLESVKKFNNAEKAIRLTIQEQMEKHSIKSVKGNWGYMTIVERANYKATDLTKVPAKFVKKALDTTKVSAHVKLTDKLPAGVESNPSRSLTIKLKNSGEK